MRHKLGGKDLRSIAKANEIVNEVNNQQKFDQLFHYLFDEDRLIVMRSADAIEKITINAPHYLSKYHKELFKLSQNATNKELKWHLALLISRLTVTDSEATILFSILKSWAIDSSESKIVRTNAIQGLFDLVSKNDKLSEDFHAIINSIEKENIPSINARIRKLKINC